MKTIALITVILLSMYVFKAQIVRNPTFPAFHVVNTTQYTFHYSTKDPFVNLVFNVRLADLLFYTTLISLMLSTLWKKSFVRKITYALSITCFSTMLISDILFGNPFVNLPKLYVNPFRGSALIDLKMDRAVEVKVLNGFLILYASATIITLFSLTLLLSKSKPSRKCGKVFKLLIATPIVSLICSIGFSSLIYVDVVLLYLSLLLSLIVFITISTGCR